MSDEHRTRNSGFTRRELVTSLLGVGILAGIGATSKSKASEVLIRPPGTTDEEQFLSLCIKCGRCISVCPTNVIDQADIFSGLANLRTPVMNYLRGGCDFCDKCIEVCPTGALSPYEGETMPIGKAELNDTCIALRTGGCTKCFDNCEYDAVILDDKMRPSIDTDKCNGCGKCVKDCPASSFQSMSKGKIRGLEIVPLSNSIKST